MAKTIEELMGGGESPDLEKIERFLDEFLNLADKHKMSLGEMRIASNLISDSSLVAILREIIPEMGKRDD